MLHQLSITLAGAPHVRLSTGEAGDDAFGSIQKPA